MRRIWRDVADLMLPVDCVGCGRVRAALCEVCGEQVWGRGAVRVRPFPEPAGLPVVHAAAPYGDAVRAALLAHKERGALALTDALGRALAASVGAGLAGIRRGAPGTGAPCATTYSTRRERPGGRAGQTCRTDRQQALVLVPVPSARRAVARRGHDPTRRIALAAARRLRRVGTRAEVLAALRQGRPVADQSGLNFRERRANLQGALELVSGAERVLEGRRIVVVDDLMTTGASLAEAARVVCLAQPQDSPAVSRTAAAVVAASPDSFEINRN